MNTLAESVGYEIGRPKKNFEKAREEQNLRNVSIARNHVIKVLSSTANEKKVITGIVDNFIKKYAEQFKSGEYSLLTIDELVAIGNGTIIDEKANVVVWAKQKYLSWDEMSELV